MDKRKTQESQTFRMWKSTLRNLREIYAKTGEPMVRILDRLIKKELRRVRKDEDNSRKSR